MLHSPRIGQRVLYQKSSAHRNNNRNGWTGTITGVTHDRRFTVRWDPVPDDTTEYQPRAYHPTTYAQALVAHHYEYIQGYIFPQSESSDEKPEIFIIAGEHGGEPVRVIGLEAARKAASDRAAKSKSGQKYLVMRAFESFVRQSPPIKHELLNLGNIR